MTERKVSKKTVRVVKNKTKANAKTAKAKTRTRTVKNKLDIDVVVAQYNENIDFLKDSPFSPYNIICYGKGPVKPVCSSCVKIESLPNVGREGHTYLSHIIQNYDNLADITVFLPASCYTNERKRVLAYKVIETVAKRKRSVFIGSHYRDVRKVLYDFTLDTWKTTDLENRKLNGESVVKPCEIQPFGKWYTALFGELKTTTVCYTGIFAVERKHVLQRPKKFYERLLSYLSDDVNPESGHYLERAWVAVFSPIPDNCLYRNSYLYE